MYPSTLNFINSGENVNWVESGYTSYCVKYSDDTCLKLGTSNTSNNIGSTTQLLTFTRNMLDLTYFSSLKIIGTVSGFGSTSNPVSVSIALVSEDGQSTTIYSNSYNGSTLSVNISKDISNLIGNYYIKVNVRKYSNWQSLFTFTTFEVS